jgi:hypothetical protein
VKIADLKDNSNLKRIAEPKENDYKRPGEIPSCIARTNE